MFVPVSPSPFRPRGELSSKSSQGAVHDGVIGHVGGLCIGDAWAGILTAVVSGMRLGGTPRSASPAQPQPSLRLAFDETWSLSGPSLPRRLFHPGASDAAGDLIRISDPAPLTAPVFR